MTLRGVVLSVLAASLLLALPSPASAQNPYEAIRLLSEWERHGIEPGSIMAVAVDDLGNVYLADSRSRIQKFDLYGTFLKEWGSRGNGPGQFRTPLGIASSQDRVYVTDSSDRIQVFDLQGRFLQEIRNTGAFRRRLNGVGGIAVDSNGNAFVIDRGNARVVKFSPAGAVLAEWGGKGEGPGRFQAIGGIAVDRRGRVYVTDFDRGGVQVFDSGGKFLRRWNPGPGRIPQATMVPGRTRGSKGVTAWLGIVPRLTPEMRATLCDSSLLKPIAIATGAEGYVYVVNGVCDRVQVYTPEGRYQGGWWVKGPPTHAMGQSTGIAIGPPGAIYVVDMNGPTVRMFGSGLTRAEQRLHDLSSNGDPLREFPRLLAAPVGELRRTGARALFPGEEFDYLGFGREPRLRSVSVGMNVVPGLGLDSLHLPRFGPDSMPAFQAALDEALDEQLGIRKEAVANGDHRKPGLHVRSSARWSAQPLQVPDASGPGFRLRPKTFTVPGSAEVEIKRMSVRFEMADTSADSPDLRMLEGGLTEPDGIWEFLVDEMWGRSLLIQDMIAGTVLPESLLALVQQSSGPDSALMRRDLVVLAADQWLRSFRMGDHPKAQPEPLGEAWQRLGFRSEREQGYDMYTYCGSALPGLAARVGENRWTDRAFLILLDQAWVTDCSDQPEGADFGNDLYVPVLTHGEAYLRDHKDGDVWPSVALRVALAHETAWSLSKDSFQDFSGLRPEAPRHRRRALELYRTLLGMTRDAQMQRAIEGKIRALERDKDTKCRVYYSEGEC